MKMLEDLAEVVRLFDKLPKDGKVSATMYADAAKAQIAASNFFTAHHATITDMAKEVAILRIKAAGTLANNLCPDHRDKQVGKSCLACRIEQLEKAAKQLAALEQAMETAPHDMKLVVNYLSARAAEIMRERSIPEGE